MSREEVIKHSCKILGLDPSAVLWLGKDGAVDLLIGRWARQGKEFGVNFRCQMHDLWGDTRFGANGFVQEEGDWEQDPVVAIERANEMAEEFMFYREHADRGGVEDVNWLLARDEFWTRGKRIARLDGQVEIEKGWETIERRVGVELWYGQWARKVPCLGLMYRDEFMQELEEHVDHYVRRGSVLYWCRHMDLKPGSENKYQVQLRFERETVYLGNDLFEAIAVIRKYVQDENDPPQFGTAGDGVVD